MGQTRRGRGLGRSGGKRTIANCTASDSVLLVCARHPVSTQRGSGCAVEDSLRLRPNTTIAADNPK